MRTPGLIAIMHNRCPQIHNHIWHLDVCVDPMVIMLDFNLFLTQGQSCLYQGRSSYTAQAPTSAPTATLPRQVVCDCDATSPYTGVDERYADEQQTEWQQLTASGIVSQTRQLAPFSLSQSMDGHIFGGSLCANRKRV